MRTDFLEKLVGIRQGVMVLKGKRFRIDITNNFFAMVVLKYWAGLLRDLVDAPSQEMFTIRLDGVLSSLI